MNEKDILKSKRDRKKEGVEEGERKKMREMEREGVEEGERKKIDKR